jgi:hypothetical protein
MTVVYRRPPNAGAAMTHALIVGVSEYHNLPGPDQPPNRQRRAGWG